LKKNKTFFESANSNKIFIYNLVVSTASFIFSTYIKTFFESANSNKIFIYNLVVSTASFIFSTYIKMFFVIKKVKRAFL